MDYHAQLKFTVPMPAISVAKDTVPEENVFLEIFFKLLYLESKGTQVLLKTIDP